jgi:molybdopterin molybdotransferase
MRKFDMFEINEAKKLILDHFVDYEVQTEKIKVEDSLGRILMDDIFSNENVPMFRRSTVDGYAVRWQDTEGVSEEQPFVAKFMGESLMGSSLDHVLDHGECVYVPTGGMVPDGADAVVMVEYSQVEDDKVKLWQELESMSNVVSIGEDVKIGEHVLGKNHKIRPQDIGALKVVGVSEINVIKRPRIAIISTGDELVGEKKELSLGEVRDINTYTITALAKQYGCEISYKGVVKDDYDAIKETIKKAYEISDIVLVSGGSSMGEKDVTADIFNELGNPGVFAHGVRLKPGKPTILAKIDGKPCFGLPGHPVSAMIVFEIFVKFFLEKIMKMDMGIKNTLYGYTTANMSSAAGRDTYQMVDVNFGENGIEISPVPGKSGMITLLSNAKGYTVIPYKKGFVKKGEKVKVTLF